MRTIHYHCEDCEDASIHAEEVSNREADAEESKLLNCICITARYCDEEIFVYLSREDALHFAETIKILAESKPIKRSK